MGLLQDLQKGVVSPEILQNFFDLEKYPIMTELIHRFQVRNYITNFGLLLKSFPSILLLYLIDVSGNPSLKHMHYLFRNRITIAS